MKFSISEKRLTLNENVAESILSCRSLGQNFVTSEEVLQQIIASADIQKGDKILEIGPGLGSLTEEVLRCGATVLAIEKDDVLHGHLKQKFSQVFYEVLREVALLVARVSIL